MRLFWFIPIFFFYLHKAEKFAQHSNIELANESTTRRRFPIKQQKTGLAATAILGSSVIEKTIFYSASGTFYTNIKLGNCKNCLKAELHSIYSRAFFNQCSIPLNCSNSARIWQEASTFALDPFYSISEVSGRLVSDYIDWGHYFATSDLKDYVSYNRTISGPKVYSNVLGFGRTPISGTPNFFESIFLNGIIANPTLCLAVKNSSEQCTDDTEAGKLIIGKSIPNVFTRGYIHYEVDVGSELWSVGVMGMYVENVSVVNYTDPHNAILNTASPYTTMPVNDYMVFIGELSLHYGVECLPDGPEGVGDLAICYVDCGTAARKLPRIGFELVTYSATSTITSGVTYYLKNNLIKPSDNHGNCRCSLAIAGYGDEDAPWNLGTSFFNGRTICLEGDVEDLTTPASIYIGTSGL